jgi:hypothetical protein
MTAGESRIPRRLDVTKDSGNSNDKSGGGQPPKNRVAAGAGRRNNVLPIDRGRRVAGRSWPISTSGISLNSGAGLLIVIGVLCGLLISESDRKSGIVSPKPPAPSPAGAVPQAPMPASAASQAPASAVKPAKPSPAVPIDAALTEGPVAQTAVPNRASSRAPSYVAAKFEATHKKVFGGCTGQLELTSAGLRFRCPKQGDLDLPIDEIASAHKDGVVLKSGEKYHFAIANHTKEQAEAIFASWVTRVETAPQQERAAAY